MDEGEESEEGDKQEGKEEGVEEEEDEGRCKRKAKGLDGSQSECNIR